MYLRRILTGHHFQLWKHNLRLSGLHLAFHVFVYALARQRTFSKFCNSGFGFVEGTAFPCLELADTDLRPYHSAGVRYLMKQS